MTAAPTRRASHCSSSLGRRRNTREEGRRGATRLPRSTCLPWIVPAATVRIPRGGGSHGRGCFRRSDVARAGNRHLHVAATPAATQLHGGDKQRDLEGQE